MPRPRTVRLGIDGKRLVEARTGPARWLEHMLWRWGQLDGPFAEMRCYTPALTEHAWARPPRLQHVVVRSPWPPLVWENVSLRRAAARDDILFGASYTLPVGYRGRAVVSIQGIYEGPHAEPLSWWHRLRFSALCRASAHRAALVLANSVSTRNDLVTYYDVDPAKIRIVYQGVGAPFGWQEERDRVRAAAAVALGMANPYMLFVGKLSPRRHVPALLHAFAAARPRLPGDTRLVLVGPNHRGLDLQRHITESGTADVVRYLRHLDQDALAAAYSGALAFILPTTHEGLSATILEAMACGTPVITVDHAPLNEGFREHALVLPSPDVELLRDAMITVAGDRAVADRLSLAGRTCAARFSWDRTADETMQALWEVAKW